MRVPSLPLALFALVSLSGGSVHQPTHRGKSAKGVNKGPAVDKSPPAAPAVRAVPATASKTKSAAAAESAAGVPPLIPIHLNPTAVEAGSCQDNIRNGDETFIDCGGPLCPSCAQTMQYTKRFNGYCKDAIEENAYQGCSHVGNGTVYSDDNPGNTESSHIHACGLACIETHFSTIHIIGGDAPPLGFTVIPSSGRCWCTWSDADTCIVPSYTTERHRTGCTDYVSGSGYERYDFVGAAQAPPELREIVPPVDGHDSTSFSDTTNALCEAGFRQGYPASKEQSFETPMTARVCAAKAAAEGASAWAMDNEYLLINLENKAGECFYYKDTFDPAADPDSVAVAYDAGSSDYYVYCDLQVYRTGCGGGSGSGSGSGGDDDNGGVGGEDGCSVSELPANETAEIRDAANITTTRIANTTTTSERDFQYHDPSTFTDNANALCSSGWRHGYPSIDYDTYDANVNAAECAAVAEHRGASAWCMNNKMFVGGMERATGQCYYYLKAFDPDDPSVFRAEADAYYNDYYVTCDLQPATAIFRLSQSITTTTTTTSTSTSTTTSTSTSTSTTTTLAPFAPTDGGVAEDIAVLPECACKARWSHGAKTYAGCATTGDSPEQSWCYTEGGECRGSVPSVAFQGWHWATCEKASYREPIKRCTGFKKKKCLQKEPSCRWVGQAFAKGCYNAGQDLPCRAFTSKWKCKRYMQNAGSDDNKGGRCSWFKNKCTDSLICDLKASECCGKKQKACRKSRDVCSWVRKSMCIPRPELDGAGAATYYNNYESVNPLAQPRQKTAVQQSVLPEIFMLKAKAGKDGDSVLKYAKTAKRATVAQKDTMGTQHAGKGAKLAS